MPAPVTDPEVWWPSGHAKTYDTYSEWLHSGHPEALEAMKASEHADDSCLTCHATLPANATAEEVSLDHAQFGVTCVACHDPHPAVDEAGNLVAERPALLNAGPYEMCVACHSCCSGDAAEPLLVGGELHYPVQALFEGWSIIEGIQGIPSSHLDAMGEDACVTCHMVRTIKIGAYGEVGTHTMDVVFPGETTEGESDSCNGCHNNISKQAMQTFIDSTQSSVARRLRVAEQAINATENVPNWVRRAVEFVGTDGSLGIHNYSYTDALLYAAELELGIVQSTAQQVFSSVTVEDPARCADCHRDVHDQWQTSPHANASLNQIFLEDLAHRGSPSYCMRCHASGYDASTGEYVFEGVVCSSCHGTVDGAVHPPAPMQASNSSELCGQCHSGAHAPTYNEWLASAHRAKGVDCMDCHTPHNNGLILGDVNTTCGGCHLEALVDEVHMGEDMNCVDCHMPRQLDTDGIHVVATGHTMFINPGTCAECHGNVHVLTADRKAPETPEEAVRVAELEQQLATLEEQAQTNWNTGVIGGAIAMFIIAAAIMLIVVRWGRNR
ncbi:MAG: multiheme c-type cytochrome [Anaerolineae bacterium]|nr:multiheme c-type cytochrome [Anaerolineae bacterium]